MKKYSILLGLIILTLSLSFVFAGCEKKAAPVEEAAAVEEVAEEKWAEGIEIWAFVGGDPGGTFTGTVQRGVEEATKLTGADVKIVYSGWLTEKMIEQLREAIASKPDGITYMGHAGDEATSALIDEAIKQGIVVTTQNVDLPRSEELYKGKGFGYVGQSLYGAGYLLGLETVRRSGAKKGDKAFIWGVLRMPGRGDRTKGMIDACEDAGIIVDYLEAGDDIMEDPKLATPVFAGYLAANPDVKIIMPDTNETQHAIMAYLRDTPEYGPDDFYITTFDLNEAIVEGIRSGYIDLILDQQPYLQGFLPILQVALTVKYGFGGLHIDTGAGMVDIDNIELVARLAQDGFR